MFSFIKIAGIYVRKSGVNNQLHAHLTTLSCLYLSKYVLTGISSWGGGCVSLVTASLIHIAREPGRIMKVTDCSVCLRLTEELEKNACWLKYWPRKRLQEIKNIIAFMSSSSVLIYLEFQSL